MAMACHANSAASLDGHIRRRRSFKAGRARRRKIPHIGISKGALQSAMSGAPSRRPSHLTAPHLQFRLPSAPATHLNASDIPPRHENRVSTRGNSPANPALAPQDPNSKNRSNLAASAAQRRKRSQPPPPLSTAGAANPRRRQRRQRTRRRQRRHCYPLVAIQLQGNSCDKRPDLHQKLAEAALSPRGAREPS
jgi:hypothetical protein